jgi:hypothetical protein
MREYEKGYHVLPPWVLSTVPKTWKRFIVETHINDSVSTIDPFPTLTQAIRGAENQYTYATKQAAAYLTGQLGPELKERAEKHMPIFEKVLELCSEYLKQNP